MVLARWGTGIALLAATIALGGCGDEGGTTGGFAAAATRPPRGVPSPTPTALVTAGIRITLTNGAAVDQQAMVSGTRLSGPADGRATSYGPIAQSVAARDTRTVDVPALAPGIWLHRIAVPATGQQQFRQSLIVDDPTQSSALDWTLFATVLTVNRAEDPGDGRCDTTCTLRDAVMKANNAKRPVLIVFDHAALGTPAQVQSNDQRIIINSPGLTIDGTDEQGNPSPLVDFSQRTYPVRITLRGTRSAGAMLRARPTDRDCPCTQNYGGTLFASARKVSFVGLQIDRVYPDLANICCGNQTLIQMGAGSPDTRVDTCLLDGGGRTLPDAVTPKGMTGRATSKDCVKPEKTGSTAAHPIVVTNSELSYCLDRGVKVQEDYLVLTDNWIHNNLRCALFAIVPNGKIDAVGNVIEENALNCPSGAPPNCAGQDVTRPDGPQVSAQGNSTHFALDGNVVRDGPFSGVFWQVGATGTLRNSFVCGMQLSGVLSERKGGKTDGASMRGTASVLNGRSGVEVRNSVGMDLGTADAPGHNAFAGNPSGKQILNSLAGDETLMARGNQWQSCYPTSGARPDACDLAAIADDATNNTDSAPAAVDASDPEPHQSQRPRHSHRRSAVARHRGQPDRADRHGLRRRLGARGPDARRLRASGHHQHLRSAARHLRRVPRRRRVDARRRRARRHADLRHGAGAVHLQRADPGPRCGARSSAAAR